MEDVDRGYCIVVDIDAEAYSINRVHFWIEKVIDQ